MFLDSNIFIHAFTSKSREGLACSSLLSRVNKGEQHACTSPLVMDEVLHLLRLRIGPAGAKEFWNRILGTQNLTLLPIDQKVVAQVMPFVDQGLDSRDAFHAAVMKANGVSVICSYDKDFDKVKGIKRQTPK